MLRDITAIHVWFTQSLRAMFLSTLASQASKIGSNVLGGERIHGSMARFDYPVPAGSIPYSTSSWVNWTNKMAFREILGRGL